MNVANALGARRGAGFTLIELLVVMVILGVLAVALLPNVLGASEAGEIAETEARLTYLHEAVRAYERDKGHYPADNAADLNGDLGTKVKADSVNAGIECLVITLAAQRSSRDSITDHEDWLQNTDADKAGTELAGLDRQAKMEVVDAWGTPIAYFCSHNDGYARKQRVTGIDGEAQTVTVLKNPRNGQPLGKGKFQLVSAGPDGLFGTEDDLSYPPRVRE